jgi:hypothetical protein
VSLSNAANGTQSKYVRDVSAQVRPSRLSVELQGRIVQTKAFPGQAISIALLKIGLRFGAPYSGRLRRFVRRWWTGQRIATQLGRRWCACLQRKDQQARHAFFPVAARQALVSTSILVGNDSVPFGWSGKGTMLGCVRRRWETVFPRRMFSLLDRCASTVGLPAAALRRGSLALVSVVNRRS